MCGLADNCTEAEHGIFDVPTWLGKSVPAQYSGELSLFVLDAGLKFFDSRDLLHDVGTHL